MVTDERREAAQFFKGIGLSIVKACQLANLSRASFYREPKDWRKADADVIDAINAELKKSSQAGFWKIFGRMQRNDKPFNHKRVYRVYKAMGLNKPRRVKRTLPKRIARPLDVVAAPNHQWALDFMHDTLYCGKRFRTLNVIDEGTRECLAIEVDTSLPAERVVRVLEQLERDCGLPKQIRLDNGPELISATLTDWCEENSVELCHIQPGKPTQNGFVERFNGSFRREFLNVYLFESVRQVQEMAWHWRIDYNEERPHDSLGGLPPSIYRQTLELENSSLELCH